MRAAETVGGTGASVRIIGQDSEDEVLMTNFATESPRNLLNNIANNLGRNKA